MKNKLATPTADPFATFDRAPLVKDRLAHLDDYLGDFSPALGGTGPLVLARYKEGILTGRGPADPNVSA